MVGRVTNSETRDKSQVAAFALALMLVTAGGCQAAAQDPAGTQERGSRPTSALGPYFTPESIDLVSPKGLRVFRLAPLPASDTEPGDDYLSYPLSIALHTLHNQRPNKTSRVAEAAFVWSNRCDICALPQRQLKPNAFGLPVRTSAGAECRVTFTSYKKANAATIVQVMALLDYPRQQYLDAARDGGFDESDILTYQAVKNQPDGYCRTPGTIRTGDDRTIATASMTDRIVLPEVTVQKQGMNGFYGVILDAEWWDNRSEEVSTAFLSRFAEIVHAKGLKVGMSNNPVVEVGRFNGLGRNLNALNQVLDDIMITVSTRDPRRSFRDGAEATLALFKGPDPIRYDRIVLQFPLGAGRYESTLEQAASARKTIEDFRLGGVMFPPLYNKPTGLACDPTGTKIRIVLGVRGVC